MDANAPAGDDHQPEWTTARDQSGWGEAELGGQYGEQQWRKTVTPLQGGLTRSGSTLTMMFKTHFSITL